MNHKRIVDENKLDNWVRENAQIAQGIIVELVWRLVAASCPSPQNRTFPLGDSIGQHGCDGELETLVGELPYIPAGKSYWEISVRLDAADKATSDYNHSLTIPLEERQSASFIFVTPLSGRRDWKNTWKDDGIQSWLDKRRKTKEWAHIQVLTATHLIDWLYRFPAVERWLAGKMGLAIEFIETLDSRWENLRTIGCPPPLCHEIFTTNRDAAKQKIFELVFNRTSSQLKLETRYSNQVADFASAWVSSLDDEKRIEAIGRCLIVTQEEAWSGVCSLINSHVLIADFELETNKGTALIQAAINKGHAVILSGMPGGIAHGNRVQLPIPNEYQIKEALEKSGYPPQRARTLSNMYRGDLNALVRSLQGLSAMPEWAQTSGSAEIAIAMMIGGWTDGKEADRAAVEAIVGKAYGEWIDKIREITGSTTTPLQFRNGTWQIIFRYESWRFLGKVLFDEHITRFKNVVVSVLREKDPRLELVPEKRFLANIHKKEFSHSGQLRMGMAETLALMASNSDALTVFTEGFVEGICSIAVSEILTNAEWDLWASLNDVLPLLAEASPYAFLGAVDASTHNGVFSKVFAQERSGITGATYLTGLLWGLETLAWSPEYFVQVCRILAGLAAVDPGGKWLNRPSNTLTTILLPWFPQTCASTEKRHAAVKVIIKEQPEVGWKLILTLLPKMHSTSCETHKPIWRQFIPDDWRNGGVHEVEDILAYSQMALELAGRNVERLIVLIEHYFNLPLKIRTNLRERLASPEISSLPESDLASVWAALNTLTSNHRKFASHENWKVPTEALEELDVITARLKPITPKIFYQYLFTGNDIDLFETTEDYENQRKKLDEKKQEAVREIITQSDISVLLDFASSVGVPWQVGYHYGLLSDLACDANVLPSLLESESYSLLQFSSGYVWGRFNSGSWSWIDAIQTDNWHAKTTGQFLALLPFCEETWIRVEKLLGAEEVEYWQKTSANAFESGEQIEMALGKLIDCGRADVASHCMNQLRKRLELNPTLVIRALATLNSGHRLDAHDIGQLITLLQENSLTNEEALCQIEFKYLPVLGEQHHGQPKGLSRKLAEDPYFFCELIRTVYRSKKFENEILEETVILEENKSKAQSVLHLLREWRIPPGTKRDSSFDISALGSWLKTTKELCLQSGHWELAAKHLGKVLFYAPRDENNLWVESVCEIFDAVENVDIRSGLSMEIFNSRGAYWSTGGNAEREMGDLWHKRASIVENKGFSRLAQVLKQIGNSYFEDAKREAKDTI